jgi:NAD(P)-dependent dehydrogenase (short-subunit alcohol dehydrogenase family)
MDIELIADGLGFPEGPVVMADGSVIVVEIAASRVSRCWQSHSGDSKRETICEIGGGPNGAAIGPDGALYICNNAGMSPPCPSHDMPESLFDSVMNLNFKGPFRLASQIGHRMVQADGGCIINISSTGALMALPGVVPYGAAKAALNAMTVSLSREYAPKVRVNTISAGPFLTDIAEAWEPKKREKQPVAIGRPGNPVEIVTAALMLASPASSYTTGALLRVDGGQR